MKNIFLIAVLVLLTACGAVPTTALDSVTSNQGFTSFGSLSSSGHQIEQEASVVYTDLSRYRYQAATLKQQGKISLAIAKEALQTSDSIRTRLDRAVANRRLDNIKVLAGYLKRAFIKLEYGS